MHLDVQDGELPLGSAAPHCQTVSVQRVAVHGGAGARVGAPVPPHGVALPHQAAPSCVPQGQQSAGLQRKQQQVLEEFLTQFLGGVSGRSFSGSSWVPTAVMDQFCDNFWVPSTVMDQCMLIVPGFPQP